MKFSDSQSIYLQVAEYICEQILQGNQPEGDRILSVRELGIALEVNPNTMIRAYDLLQGKKIIFNKRGLGYYVATGARQRIVGFRRKAFLELQLPVMFRNMSLLQMSIADVENEYNKYLKKNERQNNNK